MNLWIAVGLITFAVSAYLLRPLIRGGNTGVRRGDFDLSVYRRQLDELTADEERGVISGPEAEAARVEIQSPDRRADMPRRFHHRDRMVGEGQVTLRRSGGAGSAFAGAGQ